MNKPSVTLVIPCLNAHETLQGCLETVNEQTLRDQLRVIVVDNGSTDGSLEIGRVLADEVYIERKPGTSAARNRGLEVTRSQYFLSLDADCRPSCSNWAEAHVEALRQTTSDVCASAGPLHPAPSQDRWAQRADITPHPAFGPDGTPLYGVGGNVCYATATLRRVGGFPPLGADDWGVGLALRRSGYRFIWTSAAGVYHVNGEGTRAYFRQMRKYGRYSTEAAVFTGDYSENTPTEDLRRAWRVIKGLVTDGPREGYATLLKVVGQRAGARDYLVSQRNP